MKGYLAAALLATSMLVPTIAVGAQASTDQDGGQQASNDCDRLIATLDARKSENLPVSMEQAKAYKTSGNVQACRQANDQLQTAAGSPPAGDKTAANDAGKVIVQQPAPKVTVEQAPAEVTVTQGQPEIVIHQPAPTITVDIPQPDIVVRMPQPQVAVQQQKPQVEVQQAKPEVAVNSAEDKGAKVNLQENGQPAVQYQSDEPKIVINKPKEQPKIRFEQTSDNGTPSGKSDQLASADQSSKAAGEVAKGPKQSFLVSQIKQMPVVNEKGDNLGNVENVLVKSGTHDGYITMRTGQFLGIGQKTIVVPFSNVVVRGNQLVITGLAKDQLTAMPEWKSADTSYQTVPDGQKAEMFTAT